MGQTQRSNKSAGGHGGGLGLTGALPTLGLTKYKNLDLRKDQRNPFKVHEQTERLLVMREREREFQDFNKLEREALQVFEKDKQSKPNRKGVIREIRNIKSNFRSTTFDGLRGANNLALTQTAGSSVFDRNQGLRLD